MPESVSAMPVSSPAAASVSSAAMLVVTLAAVSDTLSETTPVSAPTVAALAAVTPETAMLKAPEINPSAVASPVSCAAVMARVGADGSVNVTEASSLSPASVWSASRFVTTFAAVSMTTTGV